MPSYLKAEEMRKPHEKFKTMEVTIMLSFVIGTFIGIIIGIIFIHAKKTSLENFADHLFLTISTFPDEIRIRTGIIGEKLVHVAKTTRKIGEKMIDPQDKKK